MKTANGVEKPLAEWTLKDVKEFCHNKDCIDCKLNRYLCASTPDKWYFQEKPKFTAQEIEDAKTLNRIIYGGIRAISRNSDGRVALHLNHDDFNRFVVFLSKKSFPSIKNLEIYKIKEIIGDSNA